MEISSKRLRWVTLLATIILWTIQSWPLPRHFATGIPCSTQNVEKDAARYMIPGDHLQLMYHFWLFRDMMTGDTPLFHNLYEFNVGDDAARKVPRAYFFPFSAVYALASLPFGHAVGWNVAGVISLWLTYFFTALLVRRFYRETWLCLCAAALAVVFPWRWVNLMGGSPMGFAMAWIPAYWLGLDLWLRDTSSKGAILAGLSALFLSFGDFQTFYFALLSTPVWMACVALLVKDWSGWKLKWVTGVPLAALGMMSIAHALMAKKAHAGSVVDQHGRSVSEVALASPTWNHFFTWQGAGLEAHAYLGLTFVVMLVLLVIAIVRCRDRRMQLVGVGMLGGMVFLILVGLGTNSIGPDGKFFLLARENLPLYARIRQPLKAWCLLPTLLTLAAAFSLKYVVRHPRWGMLLTGIFAVECICQVRASICLLDTENTAYAAVAPAGDAAPAHALVVPLWPGDSDQSSIYQYYAMQHRLRMVNGYSPVVRQSYFHEVFENYRSLNQGVLSAAQTDELLAMGVSHVILHENAFPEKVSPWPVGITLKRFMASPHLRFVKQDGPVHVFEILSEPGLGGDADRFPRDGYFPARRYLARGEGGFTVRPTFVAEAPELRLEAWVKGTGSVNGVVFDTPEFDLLRVDGLENPGLVAVDALGGLSHAVITAGASHTENPAQRLDAGTFFHAGYTVLGTGQVQVRPQWETDDRILYGPLLPIAAGMYDVQMSFESAAKVGEVLGRLVLRSGQTEVAEAQVVSAGAGVATTTKLSGQLPPNELLDISFFYAGTGPLLIKEIAWERRRVGNDE